MSIDDATGTLRDLRTDITNFQWATPRGVEDITGIDKSANERQLLLADMSANWNGPFDDGSNLAHDVFKTVSSTSVAREILLVVSGQTLGSSPQVTLLLTDYAMTRSQTGELGWSVPGVLANGAIPTWS
jgi:hypothetical protein